MKRNKYIGLTGGLLCLLFAGGCQNSEDFSEKTEEEKWQVPVSFVVQSSSLSPTRSDKLTNGENPTVNNVRDLYTDRVQVNIYRRAAGVYANNETGFVFDRKVVLTCDEPNSNDGNNYRYAHGFIELQKAYEYRSTAIGYAEQKNEAALFSFSENGNFSDASFSLTDAMQYTTPELFFGTLRYGGNLQDKEAGDVVFTYEKGKGLVGWLYRCVAGVELTLRDVPAEVTEIGLLAGTMNTESKAMYYDDFLTPGGEQNVSDNDKKDKFELMKWARPADATETTDVNLKGASLLPVTSTLSVCFMKDGTAFVVPLHLKKKEEGGSDTGGYPGGGSGTGIIPDEGKDEDEELAKGQISFQRNYYYRIAGDFQTLATQKTPLTITINPNWDGDVDLSLGDK